MILISNDEIIEFQCKMETNIMAKYNYVFDDFDDEEWRNLFDDISNQHIINKYFGTKYHEELRKSLRSYSEILNIIYKERDEV